MLSGFLTFLDVIVIGLCCISLFLTFNSLRRALKLARVGKFANAAEIFLRNWAKTSLGIYFLPHFSTSFLFFLSFLFPHLFHCYTYLPLSLSFLTLPPLSLALSQAMGSFYRNELKLPLSWWDRRPLFSFWHLFNVISDLVITAGTLLKILLNFNVSDTSLHPPWHVNHSLQLLDFVSPVLLPPVPFFTFNIAIWRHSRFYLLSYT